MKTLRRACSSAVSMCLALAIYSYIPPLPRWQLWAMLAVFVVVEFVLTVTKPEVRS